MIKILKIGDKVIFSYDKILSMADRERSSMDYKQYADTKKII